ncbi:large conductance mechanosensitive channel protein MscL [soil metagenome]
MSMFSEFRAFAMRGNVVDLAVGVIIGAAFGKIVDSVVKDLISPIIGLVLGQTDFTNLYFVMRPETSPFGPNEARSYQSMVAHGASVFGYGAFLTALIQFLIVAFAIFWVVKAINTAKAKFDHAAANAPAEAPPTPEEVVLLREIRDSLRKPV